MNGGIFGPVWSYFGNYPKSQIEQQVEQQIEPVEQQPEEQNPYSSLNIEQILTSYNC